MSYSIVRVSKVKSGTNTTGIQKHVQRENNNYENEDIDHSKTYLNYDLVNANKQNFNNLIDEKIEQNYIQNRNSNKNNKRIKNEIEVCTYRTCIYAEKTYWLEWAMC